MSDSTSPGFATRARANAIKERFARYGSAITPQEMLRLAMLAFCLCLPVLSPAETWRFAAIGDIPYSDYERRELPRMIDEIAAEYPELIVHAGDIKHSNERCSDELFRDRHAVFDASPVPFIFAPGDNEWTDCRRVIAGGYDELERLDKLREIFFSQPYSLGKKRIPVTQQPGMSEHMSWRLGPVLFVSLNVPGPDNNFGRRKVPAREFKTRNPKVIDWMKGAFSDARGEKLAGIVILMQGNPGFDHFAAGLPHEGYRELLETLRRETLAFSGQVLLIHGDTHWQRIDHPLRHPGTHQPIANFTRLETFGYPFMGWVKVFINTDASGLFRFEVRSYTPRQGTGPRAD